MEIVGRERGSWLRAATGSCEIEEEEADGDDRCGSAREGYSAGLGCGRTE